MRKLLCILLAMSMTLAMLSACNKTPVEDVENSDNQQEDVTSDENQGGEDVVLPETVDIVIDGVSEYVIVRGENAYISEVTASTELQSYLKQITGVELPIVTDSTSAVEKEIVVGKTNREAEGEFNRDELGTDGLVIKTIGQKLFLVGGEQRGTLYAVYEFLESYLGCRFFTNTIEKIPELKTISLEQIAEDKQIPVFEKREAGWKDTYYNEYSAKRKLNFARWGSRCNEAFGDRAGVYIVGGHSLNFLISEADYWESHPEYFSMNEDGERTTDQRCLTNPEVLQIVIDKARSAIESYTGTATPIVHIGQVDRGGPCLCDNCMKVYEEEGGSYSGAYVRFVNAVASEFAEEYPNVRFETFAYMFTRSVPTKTVPADNVDIILCCIEDCYSHPLTSGCYPSTNATYIDGSSNTFIEDVAAWGKICDNVTIYDYTTDFAHWAMTYPNFDVLWANMRFFADSNVNTVLELGTMRSLSVEFGELKGYLLSKILWDPYLTEDEYYGLMNEYLAYVYGPGWENIRQYIDLANELTETEHFGTYVDPEKLYPWVKAVEINKQNTYPDTLTEDMIRNYENTDWSQYWNWFRGYTEEPQILSEGERLFKSAMALAETDAQKAALDKSYCQVEYLRLCYENKNLSFGSSATGKYLINFFKANPDMFTEQEQTDFRIAIVKFAREQVYSVYETSCRDFIEKVKSYGVTEVKEAKALDYGNMDLTQHPSDWYID